MLIFFSAALLLFNILLLIKISKVETVHPFTKLIISFSFFFWHALPLTISLFDWDIWGEKYYNRIDFDYYLLFSIIDEIFISLFHCIFYYLIRKKSYSSTNLFMGAFQNNKSFIKIINTVSILLLTISIFYNFNRSVTYVESNNIEYAESNSALGFLGFFFAFAKYTLISFFLFFENKFSKTERNIQHLILLIYFISSFMLGGRIAFLGILLIYLYLYITKREKKLMYLSIGVFLISIILLPIVGYIRQSSDVTLKNIANEKTEINIHNIISEIGVKTNSVYFGSYLMKYDGIGNAGFKVYSSTVFSLIPRFLYPNKPYPGSKDGTLLGIPARTAGRYYIADSDSINVGVPTSIESLWTMGLISFIMTIIFSGYFLFYLNKILYTNLIFPCIVIFTFIRFPISIVDISPILIFRDFPRLIIIYFIFYILMKGLIRSKKELNY